jgi:hypothetical protein
LAQMSVFEFCSGVMKLTGMQLSRPHTPQNNSPGIRTIP